MPAPRRIWRTLAALFLIAAATAAFMAAAWAQRAVPALTGRVIDQTGTLSAADVQALTQKLAAFEQAKGTQIVVLMVPTTQPEDISAYANRVGNTWKIGRKGVGDGPLIVVAKDDRAMRIEVAKALEGAVPDIAAGRITDRLMAPAFRAGDFAGGINVALDHLFARIQGEPLPEPRTVEDWLGDIGILLVLITLSSLILGPVALGVGLIVPSRWGFAQWGAVPALCAAVNATLHATGDSGVLGGLLMGLASGLIAWFFLHTNGDLFDAPLDKLPTALADTHAPLDWHRLVAVLALMLPLTGAAVWAARSDVGWWLTAAGGVFFGIYPGVVLAALLKYLPLALLPPERRTSRDLLLACVVMGIAVLPLALWALEGAAGTVWIVAGCVALALLSWRLACRAQFVRLHPESVQARRTLVASSRDPERYTSSSSSGSYRSDSSSSSSYSSGGGGDFGGGGASGKW